VDNLILNFLQSLSTSGFMPQYNPMMGSAPPIPQSLNQRNTYVNKPPPPHTMGRPPPRPDQMMYQQRPPMGGMMMPDQANPALRGPVPGMHMMGQPGFGQIKMGPPVGQMMPPQGNPMMSQPPRNMPPISAVSEDAIYLQQYNELILSREYQDSSIDEKKNKFGDLIYHIVDTVAGSDNAPKITGMIIDLDIRDLEESTSSLMLLKEKIKEGLLLLEDEEEGEQSG